MPTDDQVREYAGSLPELYRDILGAFPRVDPGRRAGYGLAFPTLAAHFANERKSHHLAEVQAACGLLAERGIVQIRNVIFAHPTELGERLIAAISGSRAPEARLPELPQPTW